MEYLGGGSALDLMKAGPFQENDIAIILREIIKGLDYLHSEKKLHRDIKGVCCKEILWIQDQSYSDFFGCGTRLFYPFPKQALVFTCLQYKLFENTAGKGGIARNEQFLLFPQCFLPLWRTFCHSNQTLNCLLQTLSIWKSLKFVIWKHFDKKRKLFDAGILSYC